MNYPADVLAPLEAFLKDKKAELLARKERLTQADPFSDPDSRLTNNAAVDADAAEQFDHESLEAMQFEIDKSILEIEKAQARIADGSYGTCTSCGKMIDTDRLTVDPIVELCVECSRKKPTET